MPFVLLPSRNPIIQAAWAGLRAEERKAKKAAKAEEAPLPARKKPAKKKAKKPEAKKP